MTVVQFPKDRVINTLPERQRNAIKSLQYSTTRSFDTDVAELAKRLNAEIRYRVPQVQGRKGAVYWSSRAKKFVVLVNPEKSSAVQRYTIAHELSHILLHPDDIGVDMPVYRGDASSDRYKEREAERLAAEILIPARKLAMEVARIGRLPSQLAKSFKVSPKAMDIRLSDFKSA